MYNPSVFLKHPSTGFFLFFILAKLSNLIRLGNIFPSFSQSDIFLLCTVQFDSQLQHPLPERLSTFEVSSHGTALPRVKSDSQ